jgi:hypothetical protein
MAYADFTFPRLKKDYGIEQQDAYLFPSDNVERVEPSARLRQDITDAKMLPLYSEKAKSEAIIFPIIREIKLKNPHINVFSGYALTIEKYKELSGTPDFMISAKAKTIVPQSPIFCLFESKNKDPEEGFAQCAAEMFAARLFNQENNEPYETIYGAVTNAYDWVFLKLEDNTIYIDKERYFLNDLPTILGILQHVINQYKN